MIRILLVDDQELVRAGFRVILNSEPDFEVVGEAANGFEAIALAEKLQVDVICMDVEMPLMNGIDAARTILGSGGSRGDNGSGSDGGSHSSTGSPSGSQPSILILTTFGHESYLFEALAAGVSGFLLKTSRAEQLIEAVHTLASGQALLGPDVTRAVIERVAADRNGDSTRAAAAVPAETNTVVTHSPGTDTVTVHSAEAHTVAANEVECALLRAGLTEREQDVIRLLALGQSNAEIAASLFLGGATVKTHISNILQKLGVRDRIQAVVWAHTNHIVDS